MAGSSQERLLAAELLTVMFAQTADAFSASGGDKKVHLPEPGRYTAAVLVYVVLAAVAMFGQGPAKVASGLGGLAALGMLMAPSKRTGRSLALSVIDYFDQLTGSAVSPAAQITGAPQSAQLVTWQGGETPVDTQLA